MDILPHRLNLQWPSLFKIEIVSNNFNNEETCSSSLHSFSNKCIWLCPWCCALFFSSVYLCPQFVLEDNSFYKKQQQLLCQPLWICNSKTKIWKSQCYLSELTFTFICLDKPFREGTNKRLLFPIFFFCFIEWAKRRKVLTSRTDVQNSFLWGKESTWVCLLLMHILYIFIFSSMN